MLKNSRIFVAGHRGLVGSALWRELQAMAVVPREVHDPAVLEAIQQLRRDRAAGLLPKPKPAYGKIWAIRRQQENPMWA